jgi:hypothetical protein
MMKGIISQVLAKKEERRGEIKGEYNSCGQPISHHLHIVSA